MSTTETLWAAIGKATRSLPERREVALSDALNAVIERSGLATTAILWGAACRFPEAAMLRALGFHLARRDGFDALDDAALAWLLAQPTDDLSSLINGLSAIENVIAETEALPVIAGPWIASYVIRCLGGPWVVAFSALGVVHHLVAGDTLAAVVTDVAGKTLLPLLERLRPEAGDDEIAEIQRVQAALAQDLPPVLTPDPATPAALRAATAVRDALALPDKITAALRACAADIERDLNRLNHAAATREPGVEIHLLGRDDTRGISLSLDERVRRFLARLFNALFGIDDASDEAITSGLMVYNVAPASYTLGVRASKPDDTLIFGQRLAELLSVVCRGLEVEEIAVDDLDRLDVASRIALIELIETLSAQGSSLRVVVVDPSHPHWSRQTTLKVAKAPTPKQRYAMVNGGEGRRPLRIASTDVPQANLLDRVIALVEIVCGGQPLEAATLKVTHRQVAYYADAARVLGLLDRERVPTDRGWTLAGLRNDPVARLRALAGWFEGSVVARAWMRWAHVDLLTALDPMSAEAFLTERSVGLSTDTINRRAQTLIAWLRELSPHHYANSPR